jgi:hypothetical protein
MQPERWMSIDPKEFPKVLTLYLALSQYPILAPRVRELMRQEIFERGVISPKDFEAEVREKAIQSQLREGLTDPFAQEHPDVWQQRVSIIRDSLTDFYFAYNLPYKDFEQLLKDTLAGRMSAQEVVLSLHPELAPWDMLFAQGEAYEALPADERVRVEHHLKEIKVVLIKAMISDHLAYLGIAKEWFDIADLKAILERRIGRGKIGGKAAGVMLAQCVLRKSAAPELLERIHVPRSRFLGADLFYQFNQLNGLHVFANQKYKPEDEIRADYPEIVRSFREGDFPEDILDQLQGLLDQAGDIPLIVRSSSLLEDSFGTSFAGKYESYFCPNQGSPKENLTRLQDAIKKVYASVYNPEVLLYRRKVDLLDYDERMAVLIQATQGRRVGAYFLPDAAGVAFSRNQFRWSPRIDRDAGFLRMVWGLGTRAVDQVGSDYPRLVALSHPDLRPESSPREIHRYSQSEVDLIDLDRNAFRSLPVSKCIGPQTPYLRYIAQLYEQGNLQDLLSVPLDPESRDLVITFDGLLRRTDVPHVLRRMLSTLEEAYRSPVDTEFALILEDDSNGPRAHISLLQCRPQSHLRSERVEIPDDIASNQEIFRTHLMVPDGIVKNIRYLIYVIPHSYRELQPTAQKHQLARLIGRLNKVLADEAFILLGPGRWGSRNPETGIPVTFADIYHARALIEIADQEHKAEPSYGTHFFQDLVEANIFPLALSLEDPRVNFNQLFFGQSQNALISLLPGEAEWEPTIRVIDVPGASGGMMVELVMDSDAGEALAYLKPPAR